MRKDWLYARPAGRIGAVLTLEAAKVRFAALVAPGIEAGMGTGGPAAKGSFALIDIEWCDLLR
jgi:hypothetical protein